METERVCLCCFTQFCSGFVCLSIGEIFLGCAFLCGGVFACRINVMSKKTMYHSTNHKTRIHTNQNESRPLKAANESAYRRFAARSLAPSQSARAFFFPYISFTLSPSRLRGRKRAAASGDKPEKKPCIGTRFVLIRVDSCSRSKDKRELQKQQK